MTEEVKKPGFFARKKDQAISKSQKVVGAEAIKDGVSVIKTYSQLLNPWRKREGVRVETFEDSYERFNLDEEGLAQIYNNLSRKFYAAFVIMTAILAWMLVLAFEGRVTTALVTLSVSSVAAAVALTTAFRLHQLYVRKWCSFKEWFENDEGWWPKTWEQAVIAKKRLERDDKKAKIALEK
jgi:hypothetical protein